MHVISFKQLKPGDLVKIHSLRYDWVTQIGVFLNVINPDDHAGMQIAWFIVNFNGNPIVAKHGRDYVDNL